MTKKSLLHIPSTMKTAKSKARASQKPLTPKTTATLIANAATVQRRMKTMMMPYIS